MSAINEARNKFLAYVDFANANIFSVKSLWKQAFTDQLKIGNADKI